MLSRAALAFGGIVSLTGCASAPPPRTQASALLGDPMPAFQSTTVSGNPVMSGAYQGHKVVVSFVGTECDPCARVLSAAQAIYADDRDLVVLGVFKRADDFTARSIAARLALKFPVVVDRDGSMARHFQIQEVPSTFVVDGRGRVRWVGGSDLTEDSLAAALASVE